MISFAAHSVIVSKNGKRVADALHRAVPFAICRLPGSVDTRFYTLTGNPNAGSFIIHPWAFSDKLRSEVVLHRAEDPHIPNVPPVEAPAPLVLRTLPPEVSRNEYIDCFTEIRKSLDAAVVRKAVLSRVKKVRKPPFFNPLSFFAQMATEYPAAMSYLLWHPDLGMWAGATPEVLLKKSGDTYSTVSLAGTRTRNAQDYYEWDPKEIEEQDLVSEHIRSSLREAGITDYKEKGPHSRGAGNLVHLETTFEWKLDKGLDFINYFLPDLHPTPAVCGLPVAKAAGLLKRVEKHDRELYTGYIGVTDLPLSVQLFVNIRCMQVGASHIALYVGGGITRGSELKQEWQETEAKAKTLLNLIND